MKISIGIEIQLSDCGGILSIRAFYGFNLDVARRNRLLEEMGAFAGVVDEVSEFEILDRAPGLAIFACLHYTFRHHSLRINGLGRICETY